MESSSFQFRKFFEFSGAVFLPQLFGLLTLIVLTQNLSLSDYAIIAMLEAALMLITPLMCLGIDRAAAKYSTTISVTLVNEVANGVLLISALLFFIPYLGLYFLFNIGSIFEIAFLDYILIYLIAYSLNLIALLQVKNQFAGESISYLIAGSLKTFFPMLFITIGIFFLDLGVKSFIYGTMTASIFLVIYSRTKGRLFSKDWKKNLNLAKTMVLYGLPLIPAFISGWLISWSNRFFLNLYVSDDQLGLYSAVFKYSLLFFLFIQAVNLYITPLIYRNLEENNNHKVQRYLITSTILFLFGALLYTYSMIIFLPFFKIYAGLDLIIGIGVINYLSGIAALTTQLVLLFHKKTQQLMYGAVFYASICMLSYWLLIPKFQILGVLFSNVLCVAISNIVFLLLSNQAVKLRSFTYVYSLINILISSLTITIMIKFL